MHTGVIFNKALFVVTGTYNDMAMRPYTTNLDTNIVNQFMEATNGGVSIAPTTVSGVASSFLKPSAQAQSQAVIDNGWDAPRLRFIMELIYPDSGSGLAVRKFLQGYTNHVGATSSGAVDPNMVLYFNNVVTLRQSVIQTPHGTSQRTAVSEASQLLRGEFNSNILNNWSAPSNSTWTMRPEDIFSNMSVTHMGLEDSADLRLSFATSPIKKSRRSNSSAPYYVSSVLDNYRKTMDYGEHSDNLDFPGAMNNARGMVQDAPVSGDLFFQLLMMDETNFKQGGFVTYSELCRLFPDFDNASLFILDNSVQQETSSQAFTGELHQRGQTEHWGGASNETLWSTILSQSVPSIMMDLMLTKIAFRATNQTLNSSHEVIVLGAESFAENLDLTPYISTFIERLKVEVLRGLSSNNYIDYNVTVIVDVIGETRISISIAGGPTIDYATPSFADALFAPVLTMDVNSITSVGYDISALAGNLGEDAVHNYSNYSSNNSGGNGYGSI